MPKLTINGMEIEVAPGTSILQAAEQLGVEVPRFCYHDRLSVPANCRMCLVEVKGGPPKPVASCAMACGDNMVVETDSEMVRKARKGVMEMMLINHPLDCPICDQGGECDLQDQAVSYGFDRSRYYESKRAKKNPDLGPLVKTVMTRCIQCTRCVRFCEEISGTEELGYLNRGEDSEIGTFVDGYVTNELSGNLVDVCPVGALTSGPYAFTARPWELKKTESIDVHDALGCNIRIDSRGGEVMRVMPRLHEEINEEWINDRSRFAVDGLKKRRLDRPWIRDPDTAKLREATWDEAFAYIAERLKGVRGENIAALCGDLCEVESVVALKDLMLALGSPNMDCRTDGARFDVSDRSGYLFNAGISGIDTAGAILLIGTNPRWEATLVNARIRKNWLSRRVKVGLIGEALDLTYPYEHLGAGPADLEKLLKSKGGFAEILKNAENPMVILGSGALAREDGEAVQALAREAAETFGGSYNLLHRAASRVGALEAGFVPGQGGRDFHGILEGTKKGDIKVLYLLGADEFDARAEIGWKTFVIYQGHHGDAGAHRADVILPGCAYTEKDGLYVNTEGRVQIGLAAATPPGEAREDWKILRALSERLGRTLPYDTLMQLRQRIMDQVPHLAQVDVLPGLPLGKFGGKGKVLPDDFKNPVENFYLTNAICRASDTMHECVAAFGNPHGFQEAAQVAAE